jgi:hypothetical protein
VKELVGVALVDASQRSLGKRGLDLHHLVGLASGDFGRIIQQLEGLRHVRDVLGADVLRFVVLLGVVVAVGQAQAAAARECNHARGVVEILV